MAAVKKKTHVCTHDGCAAACATSSELKTHLRVHTGEKPFHCAYEGCNAAFSQAGSMIKHTRIHTGERPHACLHDGCNAAYARSTDLQIHNRIHTGEKPFRCGHDGCSAAFSRASVLTQHERIHTGERPYACMHEGCAAAFSQPISLIYHTRTHTGERPFKCQRDGCNAAFTTSGNLNKHDCIHTGEKAYKCTHNGCNSAFARAEHLAIHGRIHTGETPYACANDGCNAAFSTGSNLIIHTRTHTGERPFKCQHDGCNAAFAQSGSLKEHKTYWHTPEGHQRHKLKEQALANYLTSQGVEYKREHRVDFSCVDGGTFCRVDFLLQLTNAHNGAFIVLLENGEGAHKDRATACEVRRMLDVPASLVVEGNTLPIVWIRFNCDAFQVNGERRRVLMRDRYATLKDLLVDLKTSEARLPPMSVHYLFYDATTTSTGALELEMCADSDFPATFRALVTGVHVAPQQPNGRKRGRDKEEDCGAASVHTYPNVPRARPSDGPLYRNE
jgi:hypothetical protein